MKFLYLLFSILSFSIIVYSTFPSLDSVHSHPSLTALITSLNRLSSSLSNLKHQLSFSLSNFSHQLSSSFSNYIHQLTLSSSSSSSSSSSFDSFNSTFLIDDPSSRFSLLASRALLRLPTLCRRCDAVAHWPALSLWSPSYLARRAEVPLLVSVHPDGARDFVYQRQDSALDGLPAVRAFRDLTHSLVDRQRLPAHLFFSALEAVDQRRRDLIAAHPVLAGHPDAQLYYAGGLESFSPALLKDCGFLSPSSSSTENIIMALPENHTLKDILSLIHSHPDLPYSALNASLLWFSPHRRDNPLWIGHRDVTVPWHFDYCHNVYVQIVGRKTFCLLPHAAHRATFPFSHPGYRQSSAFFHAAHLASLSPNSNAVSPPEAGHCVTLQPGDALYIPPFTWHVVRAESLSVSVSFFSEELQVLEDRLTALPIPFEEAWDFPTYAAALSFYLDRFWPGMREALVADRYLPALGVAACDAQAVAAVCPPIQFGPLGFQDARALYGRLERGFQRVRSTMEEYAEVMDEAIEQTLLATYFDKLILAFIRTPEHLNVFVQCCHSNQICLF